MKTIFSNKKNEERGIEIAIEKEGKQLSLTLNLNGSSHSAELMVGMALPVFVKRGSKVEYLVDLTSLFSR
ncbi:MAG TPA: hypothetical protein VFA93_02330 [Patescibacteria group bacterium]|nr:hypothetical protein [Patescibacteria group bacterium]